MKRLVLGTVLGVSTLFGASTDGLNVGLGFGSTSTTTTVITSGYYNSTSIADESGGTAEFSVNYGIQSNYIFGLTIGNIAVEGDSTVGYTILTADYAFMKDSKWRPFVGYAIGKSKMDYTISGLNISETASASGLRLGVLYDYSKTISFGYKYQMLSTDLKGSDSLYKDTSYETKFEIEHKDFDTSLFFMTYKF
jgi:hypothetical protein